MKAAPAFVICQVKALPEQVILLVLVGSDRQPATLNLTAARARENRELQSPNACHDEKGGETTKMGIASPVAPGHEGLVLVVGEAHRLAMTGFLHVVNFR